MYIYMYYYVFSVLAREAGTGVLVGAFKEKDDLGRRERVKSESYNIYYLTVVVSHSYSR